MTYLRCVVSVVMGIILATTGNIARGLALVVLGAGMAYLDFDIN